MKSMVSSGISDKNKELILKFVNNCFAEGLSKNRVVRYVNNLKQMALILNKDYDQCTKDDIKSVVAIIEMREWSEHTKVFYKVTLKKFYSWLFDCDKAEYPDCVKWIRTTLKRNKLKTPEVMTREEVERMISFTDNLRDNAFLSVLWESGCRIGELFGLRKNNVEYDEHGAVLMVNGKTGYRRVRVINSAKTLQEWTDKLNDESFLWINRNGNLLCHGYVEKLLKRLKTKANICKRVYPHAFRHSRATYLASYLSEAQMKVFFGWTQSSKMASIYVHLSGKDLDKSLIELSQL